MYFFQRQQASKIPDWFAELDEENKNEIIEELEDIRDVSTAVTTLKQAFNLNKTDKQVGQLLSYLESPAAKRGREVDFLNIGPAANPGSSNELPDFDIGEDDPLVTNPIIDYQNTFEMSKLKSALYIYSFFLF